MRLFPLVCACAVAVTTAGSARAFPGANGAIAFVRDQSIWAVDADGRNARRLTEGAFDLDPAWSPDGTRLAYTTAFPFDLALLGRGGPARLTNDSIQDLSPTWSPDGTRLAFVRTGPGFNQELWTIAADGTGATRIRVESPEPSTFLALEPAWSPDGSRIAFGSNTFSGVQIFTIRPDGSGERQLTFTPGNKHAVSWSPDGSRLAFVSDGGGTYEIHVAAADGSGERAVTSGSRTACPPFPCIVPRFDPTWSPDGAKLAFVHDRDGDPKLYVANADGSGQQALVTLSGQPGLVGAPDWQPAAELRLTARFRPSRVRVGAVVPITFRIVNSSSLAAQDVLLSVTTKGGSAAGAGCAGSPLQCRVRTIAGGGAATVVVRARPRAPGRLLVNAVVSATTPEATRADNRARVSVTVTRRR